MEAAKDHDTRSERPEATVTRLATHRPSAGPNRRVYPRYSVELDVSVGSEHNFYAGFIENMSVGGVFMATHLLKPLGELMELNIHLPGHLEPVRARGEVRWVREYNEDNNVPPGIGIRFVEVDAASIQAIEEFLASRDPIFFDED
jgi:uncharacterized protein (TIGR02266 family)